MESVTDLSEVNKIGPKWTKTLADLNICECHQNIRPWNNQAGILPYQFSRILLIFSMTDIIGFVSMMMNVIC